MSMLNSISTLIESLTCLAVFSRASLQRSPRTRTRKNVTSSDADIVCPSPRSSIVARPKTRPPPLQIIPELSENELDIDATHSPATARPMQFTPRQPESVSSRITLSAYAFSIDDALLMFGSDTPRSPALSASSSTSGGASSDVPTTPGTSDDEDGYYSMLHTPRFRPQCLSIRPLCITKTHSLICQEDDDIHSYLENEEKIVALAATEAEARTEATEEAEQDFYAHEFEDFISLFPAMPSPTCPARRDSLILIAEVSPAVVEVPEAKTRSRSRHSKPLPLLPPATPPASSFPPITSLPPVLTTAQKSTVRRKRNIPSLLPPPPAVSRPLPRMSVPLDVENCVFPEENLDVTPREPIVTEEVPDAEAAESIYSQPSLTYTLSATTRPLPPAIPETIFAGMHGEVTLPRSSTDSDAPRSSVDSTSSFTSFSNDPFSSSPFPNSPTSEERLRSRWSTSTLGSIAVEPPRTIALFSPLRSVFGSRRRGVPLPPQRSPPRSTPSKLPKNKHDPKTSPPSNSSVKHVRQSSRSSTSSAGTSSSEREGHDGSPIGLKRMPIPIAMFLRAA